MYSFGFVVIRNIAQFLEIDRLFESVDEQEGEPRERRSWDEVGVVVPEEHVVVDVALVVVVIRMTRMPAKKL